MVTFGSMAVPSTLRTILGTPVPAVEEGPRGTPERLLERPVRVPAPAPRLLPEAPAIFPWLEARFSPGEATLWIGADRCLASFLELLYAGSARAGGSVSLLEGANRLHPYRVAEAGRRLGGEPIEVLRRVRLARAFTAYQLVALVDGWAREIRRSRPTLLVAHGLTTLFETDDVPVEERGPLLGHIAATLRGIAEGTRIPMLLTLPGSPARFPGLADRGPRFFDVVRFHPRSGALHLEAYREAVRLSLVPRADGQRGLEEFAVDPLEEVMAWDGPPRRTGRPWRNG
ncbi:MAG TPA: hypothetical protein VMH90_05765 [Thermoplasmata archaeon]|nr:hypothetical protein [Thermoplasmata archaeon]